MEIVLRLKSERFRQPYQLNRFTHGMQLDITVVPDKNNPQIQNKEEGQEETNSEREDEDSMIQNLRVI